MFRRKWSSLPEDPHFPSDLKELGYFINEDDEVRSIENPNNYFKYFISRNPRWNDRQRFAMNQALQKIIHERLEKMGMVKVLLPIDVDVRTPHVPIFMSSNITVASRVVIIFGETVQDLGVLAHRVLGGPGGVAKGSMLSIVDALMKQRSSATDSGPPGIILANTGELIWSPEERRTLSQTAFDNAPMPSAVHNRRMLTSKNEVPYNEDAHKHVHYIFSRVITCFVDNNASIDIVGVGDGADLVEQYLDLPPVWNIWKKRINCFALVGGMLPEWELKNPEFVNGFLRNKARAYVTSIEPAGMVLSGPDGNPKTTTFTQRGCPVLSSGEPHYTEVTLITGRDMILDWLQEVALTPKGQDYVNPEFHVVFEDPDFGDDSAAWSQWQNDEGDEKAGGEGDKPEGEGPSGVVEGKEPRLVIVERPNEDQNENEKNATNNGENGEKN